MALYSVTDSTMERCTIEDTVDEAIDFDHFTVRCRAEGNVILRCPRPEWNSTMPTTAW